MAPVLTQAPATEWLLEGFRYELEATTKPKTVDYYYGHARRFFVWAQSAGIPSDIRSIAKHDIQAFFPHLLTTTETAEGGNGSRRRIKRTERTRWPYYHSLKRLFAWAVNEGYLEQNPLDGINLKPPQDTPVEPYRPEHIQRMIDVLDHDWKIARTPRQKMLAARDKAVLLLFLESGLRCREMTDLVSVAIDLARQRVAVRRIGDSPILVASPAFVLLPNSRQCKMKPGGEVRMLVDRYGAVSPGGSVATSTPGCHPDCGKEEI